MQAKITLPDSWNEVTLRQFQEIGSLEDNDHKTNHIISILSDQDEEVINKMTVDSRLQVINHLKWVFGFPSETEYKRLVKIEDVDYYLQDYSELTIGERIDLKEYCKDTTKNLHKIFSILYKPEVKRADTSDLFLNKMMIGDVYGSLVFFYRIANRSIEIMQDYLMNDLNQTLMNQKKNETSA